MKLNVKDHALEAVVRTENGCSVSYGDARSLLTALGVPVATGEDGSLLVALRPFAGAARLPIHYEASDNTVYLASKPLPPLPPQPVGADQQPWHPVTAPITSGPGDRRPGLYERVIKQFEVAINPRYRQNRQGCGETYCNIFLWDVTRALCCQVPHWVVGDGEPSEPGRGRELDANGAILWLRGRGRRDYGWRPATADEALAAANQGRPAVAAWYNPCGIGHVAMVRPGQPDPVRGVRIAQAGARNFDDGFLVDGFGEAVPAVKYFMHD